MNVNPLPRLLHQFLPPQTRSLALIALLLFSAASLIADDLRLTGQIVCCQECWNKADRRRVPFGTDEDLAGAAGCIANGEIPLLAVDRDGKTVMYTLAEGRLRFANLDWLDYVGARTEVAGDLRSQNGKPSIRVHSLKIIEPSLAVTESRRLLGATPELALPDLSGVRQSLASRRGRVVVLNFWGTFCPPCIKEIPELAAIQSQYAALGVEVIGAAADPLDDRAKVIAFIRRHGINFPVWLGAAAEDMRRFGLGEALPATVILDRDGKLVWQKRGMIDRAELQRQIDALLDPPPAAAASTTKSPRAAAAPPSQQDASLVPS